MRARFLLRVCAKARAVITGGVWKAAACYRRSLAKPRKWMLFLLFLNTNPLILRNEPRKSVFMMLLSDCWVWASLARRMSQGETNMYIGVHKSSFTHSSRFSFTYTYADLTLQICFIVQEHVFWMCENTFYPGFQGVFPRKTPSGENWPPALCKHREVALKKMLFFFFDMLDYWSSQCAEGGVSKHCVRGQKHLLQDSHSCFSTVEWPYSTNRSKD